MPWKPRDAYSHTHKATTPGAKKQFSTVANKVLDETGDEGQAIRIANAAVARRRASGGLIETALRLATGGRARRGFPMDPTEENRLRKHLGLRPHYDDGGGDSSGGSDTGGPGPSSDSSSDSMDSDNEGPGPTAAADPDAVAAAAAANAPSMSVNSDPATGPSPASPGPSATANSDPAGPNAPSDAAAAAAAVAAADQADIEAEAAAAVSNAQTAAQGPPASVGLNSLTAVQAALMAAQDEEEENVSPEPTTVTPQAPTVPTVAVAPQQDLEDVDVPAPSMRLGPTNAPQLGWSPAPVAPAPDPEATQSAYAQAAPQAVSTQADMAAVQAAVAQAQDQDAQAVAAAQAQANPSLQASLAAMTEAPAPAPDMEAAAFANMSQVAQDIAAHAQAVAQAQAQDAFAANMAALAQNSQAVTSMAQNSAQPSMTAAVSPSSVAAAGPAVSAAAGPPSVSSLSNAPASMADLASPAPAPAAAPAVAAAMAQAEQENAQAQQAAIEAGPPAPDEAPEEDVATPAPQQDVKTEAAAPAPAPDPFGLPALMQMSIEQAQNPNAMFGLTMNPNAPAVTTAAPAPATEGFPGFSRGFGIVGPTDPVGFSESRSNQQANQSLADFAKGQDQSAPSPNPNAQTDPAQAAPAPAPDPGPVAATPGPPAPAAPGPDPTSVGPVSGPDRGGPSIGPAMGPIGGQGPAGGPNGDNPNGLTPRQTSGLTPRQLAELAMLDPATFEVLMNRSPHRDGGRTGVRRRWWGGRTKRDVGGALLGQNLPEALVFQNLPDAGSPGDGTDPNPVTDPLPPGDPGVIGPLNPQPIGKGTTDLGGVVDHPITTPGPISMPSLNTAPPVEPLGIPSLSGTWGHAAQQLANYQLQNYNPTRLDVGAIASTPPGYLAHGSLPPLMGVTPTNGGGGGNGPGDGNNGNPDGGGGALGGGNAGNPPGVVTNPDLGPVLGGGSGLSGNFNPDAAAGTPGLFALRRGGRAGYAGGGKTEAYGPGDPGSGELQVETYPFTQFAKDVYDKFGPPPIPHSGEEARANLHEPMSMTDFAKEGGKYAAETVAPPLAGKGLGMALKALPKSASIPGMAWLSSLFGMGSTEGEDKNALPPEATQRTPAQENLDQVMRDYQALQKRYDDAVKHRDQMLRGTPAAPGQKAIAPGPGPLSTGADKQILDLGEQLKGYTDPKTGLLTQARNAVNMEHQDTKASNATKLSEKYPPTPWQQFQSDYLPNLGYPIGVGAGLTTGHFESIPFARAGANRAARADAIFDRPNPTPRGWSQPPARASRVDQFWTEGGSREPPFETVPGGNPPFRSNPNQARVAPTSQLYRRSPARMSTEAGANLGLGALYAYEGFDLGEKNYQEAKADRIAAQQAYEANPSKVTVEALNAARAKEGWWDGARNIGRFGVGAHIAGGGASMAARGPQRPTQINLADSERRALEAYLAQRRLRSPSPGGGPPGGNQQLGGQQPPIQGGPLSSTNVPPEGGGTPGGTLLPPPTSGGQGQGTQGSGTSSELSPPSRSTRSPRGRPQKGQGKAKGQERQGEAQGGRTYRADGGAVHAGPITHAADGGRTDTVPLDVASGAYVVPADIVSALGQGDTSAGYRVLSHMFGDNRPGHGAGHKVPIMAAGGEYVISPEAVAGVGRGNLAAGHDALDHWVKVERRKTIMALNKLPPPARD